MLFTIKKIVIAPFPTFNSRIDRFVMSQYDNVPIRRIDLAQSTDNHTTLFFELTYWHIFSLAHYFNIGLFFVFLLPLLLLL